MKKSERKKGFPGLRRAGSLAGRGPMPAAPGSFLVGPSFLGVVETTKEIITYVLASCKHEFQQPKRWTKSGSEKSSSQSTKFLMIPRFCAGFRLLRNTGNTENSRDVLCIFSGARWGFFSRGKSAAHCVGFMSYSRVRFGAKKFGATTPLGYP